MKTLTPAQTDAIDDMRRQPQKFLHRAHAITSRFSEATKTMRANPEMTYGQAVGYSAGIAARALGDQFAGLSRADWDSGTDDYAHGYRQGFLSSGTLSDAIYPRVV